MNLGKSNCNFWNTDYVSFLVNWLLHKIRLCWINVALIWPPLRRRRREIGNTLIKQSIKSIASLRTPAHVKFNNNKLIFPGMIDYSDIFVLFKSKHHILHQKWYPLFLKVWYGPNLHDIIFYFFYLLKTV